MKRAIAWILRNTTGEIIAAVEGTCSHGASLTRALTAAHIPVVEAKPPKKAARTGAGKNGAIDAQAAALSILSTGLDRLLHPRAEGERAALSVLLAIRRRVQEQGKANRNALNALGHVDLGMNTRRALTDKQLIEISLWRDRTSDSMEQRSARKEAIDLAKAIHAA